MKFVVLTIFILLIGTAVWAQLPYYPKTSIAEDFTSTWCTNCAYTFAGLDVVESQLTPSDFFSVRYYTQSGPDWTFPASEDRFSYYNVMGVPSVIFNGMQKIDGGTGMETGTVYADTLALYKFGQSPVKMEIADFDPSSLHIQVQVTMYDSVYALTNAPIYFLLMQDNVGETHKNVCRDILTDTVNLSGSGNQNTFQKDFSPSMTVNHDSLWVAAFIQTGDHVILQAVSSKPTPPYYYRVVLPFKQKLTGDLDTAFQSVPFPVWNIGFADNFTIKLVMDDAPGYWDLGFCNTTGSCFPQNIAIPFNLPRGEYMRFYLDVNPHVSGVAHFHFEFTSSHNPTPLIMPFTFSTSDVANDDQAVPTIHGAIISNYPNPFAGDTHISYRYTPQKGEAVNMEIYNIKGQKVRNFSSLSIDNGTGNLVWNGMDDQGNRLSSGIYFSRILGRSGTATHKMILLR